VSGSVRLTRRGRIVLVLAVLTLALVGFALIGSPAVSTGEAHHAAKHTVVIHGGETLWDLAGRIAPGEDPRVVISDIVDLNNLSDAGSIRVGQKLYVPSY
jgi:nucleoid-associated protein YgaU